MGPVNARVTFSFLRALLCHASIHMRRRERIAVALIGNDGVVGIGMVLGGDTVPHRAVVQIGGDALKMPAQGMKRVRGLPHNMRRVAPTPRLTVDRSRKLAVWQLRTP